MCRSFKWLIASLMLLTTTAYLGGCDSMYGEEQRNVEREVRRRLSGQNFPGYKVDFKSIHAHGFGRSGAPRTVKREYCYVDAKLIGADGHNEHHRFKVFYLSQGKVITNILLDD